MSDVNIAPNRRDAELMLAIRQLDDLYTKYTPNDARWQRDVASKTNALLDILMNQGNPRIMPNGSLTW